MFYERYLELCRETGLTPSGAALEIGFSKTIVSRWKRGGGCTDATLKKVADYFGVSLEWLKGETDDRTKKADPVDGVGGAILALLHTLSNDQLLDLQARANELLRERMQQ